MIPLSRSSRAPVSCAPKPHSPTSPAAKITADVATGRVGFGPLPPGLVGEVGAAGELPPQCQRSADDRRATAKAASRRFCIVDDCKRGALHYDIDRARKAAGT